ncbi:MAG: NAD(P)-binding domain-containing protein, partial [Bacteroidales bacterium]|nr:NAD(P)-binding domain-containing protein [Bacteroidales bacterium]
MINKETILGKIKSNSEVIGIIGLGYVGLPLAVNFAEAGIKVIGFEKSQAKADMINHGTNYIGDIRDAVLREVVVDKLKLEATTDASRMKECDALIIAVPTPLDKFRKPDMSYIESACLDIGQNMKAGTFVSLESTTYPTTTEDFMLPIIERESGLKQGTDFWLAYSPERVDPGNKQFHTRNTPKVLGAMSEDGVEIGEALY